MGSSDAFRPGPGPPGGTDAGAPDRSELLDVLGMAAVVLDAAGRIVLWSPQAEELLGYTPDEALGRFAARLLVTEEHFPDVLELFSQVMSGDTWAGIFPLQHRDGSTRLVEFRNMRLVDDRGDVYALGLATDRSTVQRMERDLALSARLVAQSPAGMAVVDTDLRCVAVNPALERLNGVPVAEQIGRPVLEMLPFLDSDVLESAMRRVLASGDPLLAQETLGPATDAVPPAAVPPPTDTVPPAGDTVAPAGAGPRTGPDEGAGPESAGPDERRAAAPGPPGQQEVRAWSVSYFRLEDASGHVLGLCITLLDVTARYRAATEATRARHRLALVADASARIGTTLDLQQTASELADVAVPELADVAAVDVLDAVLSGRANLVPGGGPAIFRALALAAAYPTEAVRAADPPGELAKYDADRLVTQCVLTGRPIHVPRVREADLPRIARDPEAVRLLAAAGVHSYLAVPLIARGEVLGALDLKRARNELPFDADDVVLASELAARAAVCIDNARWYQSVRDTAVTLQRSLLPQAPARRAGLEVASRYQPAGAAAEVGGDWFDVLPLAGDRTALVVGDVMGSGITAAATMGRLRTATQTLAELDFDPARLLRHLDKIITRLEPSFATCVYAVYDPHRGLCRVASAGHLPPALVRPGRPSRLLDLTIGAPLGTGGAPFRTTTLRLAPDDQLVLYTDGLVETRHQDIDTRLDTLLELLDDPYRPLEATCDVLLRRLRGPIGHDDVALLIARIVEHH
ncbi:SpoIIE family protein phosphatase [Streptomyces sp. LX-29]|uniref:SpoIIE family protein phosphatase n=1 Tax=Streptomyces sp. LX-29 TaxID=2900152 RepID=UPI00240D0AFD|nr:SpoIIE family protein phosphatase [Streptomyces sp. LX-29]WFB11153.1 SpoIIE family protein phosphatase [Streptomyces sp. LX-29]